jgi:hypothetical protein
VDVQVAALAKNVERSPDGWLTISRIGSRLATGHLPGETYPFVLVLRFTCPTVDAGEIAFGWFNPSGEPGEMAVDRDSGYVKVAKMGRDLFLVELFHDVRFRVDVAGIWTVRVLVKDKPLASIPVHVVYTADN